MIIISEIINFLIIALLSYTIYNIRKVNKKEKLLPSLMFSYIIFIIFERINYYFIKKLALSYFIFTVETILLITFIVILIRLRAKRRK